MKRCDPITVVQKGVLEFQKENFIPPERNISTQNMHLLRKQRKNLKAGWLYSGPNSPIALQVQKRKKEWATWRLINEL